MAIPVNRTFSHKRKRYLILRLQLKAQLMKSLDAQRVAVNPNTYSMLLDLSLKLKCTLPCMASSALTLEANVECSLQDIGRGKRTNPSLLASAFLNRSWRPTTHCQAIMQ